MTEPSQAVSLVVVDGPSRVLEVPADGLSTQQHQTLQQRLDEAAVHGAYRATGAVMSAALIGSGVVGAAGLGFHGHVALAYAFGLFQLLCAIAPWWLRSRPRGQAIPWQVPAATAALCMAFVMAAPWTPWVAKDRSLMGLAVAVLGVLAVAGAAALASERRTAAVMAISPLTASAAVLHAFEPLDAMAWSLLLGSACASAVAGVMAWWRGFAWRRLMLGLLERDEHIAELEHERDAALRADEEKSRFLAIASHDLRQPVHALGLFAATLDKRLHGTREEPLVRNMIRSIDGLDRSFNAMLDVSRLDAGTIEPKLQRFPLRDLFRRLHMHFAGQAELRDLGLRFSPGGKAVTSDPQLLERVLGNLVQNAIKYTEAGGVVVVARTTASCINVEVWDTGVGIRADELPRVFDEFYQVGRGERSRAQGLGMGLAIVKRLCRLLGHSLEIASRPGRGTMFRVGIPLSGLSGIEDATAAADTLPQPVLDARTVLVLDDEEAIREGLRMLLEEWGYEAVVAATIEQAERLVQTLPGPPDLILSDLHLGDGPDGIAAIATLRRQCGHDVTAVLITGDTSHEEMRRVTESGHPVLFKPVQPRKLFNVVRGLLS